MCLLPCWLLFPLSAIAVARVVASVALVLGEEVVELSVFFGSSWCGECVAARDFWCLLK